MRSRLSWLVLAGFMVAISGGCSSNTNEGQPKAETTAGTKQLEKKTPGAGGAGPGGGQPGPKPD